MTSNEYQQAAMRTAGHDNTTRVLDFIDHAKEQGFPDPGAILLGVFGLGGEAGEAVDYMKKIVFHGSKYVFDKDKLLKEIGDVMWYCARTCSALGANLEDVMKENITKLEERYPTGFTSEASLKRVDVK